MHLLAPVYIICENQKFDGNTPVGRLRVAIALCDKQGLHCRMKRCLMAVHRYSTLGFQLLMTVCFLTRNLRRQPLDVPDT